MLKIEIEPHLKLLLISIVFNEDLFQLMVDAFHAAGHPGDRGLWHSDVRQWHLGRLRHGKLLQRAYKHTHMNPLEAHTLLL